MSLLDVRRRELLAPAAAVVASMAVQCVALGSDFRDDDFLYLYEGEKLGPLAALLTPFGHHFMASFKLAVAVLHTLFGMHAVSYFAVVLLTHLVNVVLLYSIVRALSGSEWVAGFAAGLWGSAPAFQGTLSWFSAYSHMLSTTAALWALWEMARAAEARRPATAGALVRTSFVLLAGSATMLSGSITAAIFPAVVLMFLPRESAPVRTALWLVPSALLSTLIVARFAKSDAPMAIAPAHAAVVFFALIAYAVGVVVAAPLVTAHAEETGMGLFAGGSSATSVEVSALFFSLLFAVVLWRLVRGDWVERRMLLALLGLASALYAGIALGRSVFTLTHSLGWMATRDRYHYDANLGFVIAVAIAIAKLRPRRAWSPKAPVLVCIAIAWIAANAAVARTIYVGGERSRQIWTRNVMDLTDGGIRALAAQVPRRGVLYVRNDAFTPASFIYAMGAPRADFPGIGAYWIIARGADPVDGRTIRFVEEDAQLFQAIQAQSRQKVASMFVTPLEVARAGATMRTVRVQTWAEYLRQHEHRTHADIAGTPSPVED